MNESNAASQEPRAQSLLSRDVAIEFSRRRILIVGFGLAGLCGLLLGMLLSGPTRAEAPDSSFKLSKRDRAYALVSITRNEELLPEPDSSRQANFKEEFSAFQQKLMVLVTTNRVLDKVLADKTVANLTVIDMQ